LVGGHLYGDSQKSESLAATFVAAIDELATADIDLMICCGDTFRFSSDACFEQTTAKLSKLPFPVFHAVGNHDVAVRSAYVQRFGETYGAFVHAGCAFVLLDTEVVPWQIEGEQLQFLSEVLVGSNALDGLTGPNRFAADVLPLLTSAASLKPVYWCGGDIGLAHTLPAFFDHDAQSGVTFLATGLGDDPRDAVIEVEVVGGDVHLRLRSLRDGVPGDLADYGVTKWRERFFPKGMPPQFRQLRALLPK